MSLIDKSYIDKLVKEIDIFGFTKISNFLDSNKVSSLLKIVNAEYLKINNTKEGFLKYRGVPERDARDKILYNLPKYDKSFIDLLAEPLIREIAFQKLNDPFYRFLSDDKPNYILSFYNARSSGNKLDLHIDSNFPYTGSKLILMQFAVLLEDSFADTGSLFVVPGSHQSGKYTDRSLENYTPLEGKAGDLIVWDSRLWHGTYENKKNVSSWMLIATLSAWWIKQSMDFTKIISEEIYTQCTDEQKLLLGFCSIPPHNENERINTKCSYDFLKKSVREYY